MAKADKFAKTISDDELDEVAGGSELETKKDGDFLRALGFNIREDKNSPGKYDQQDMKVAFAEMNIRSSLNPGNEHNTYRGLYGVLELSRQDMLITAMRAKKKFLDIEQYM